MVHHRSQIITEEYSIEIEKSFLFFLLVPPMMVAMKRVKRNILIVELKASEQALVIVIIELSKGTVKWCFRWRTCQIEYQDWIATLTVLLLLCPLSLSCGKKLKKIKM